MVRTGVVPIQRRGFLQYPTHAWNSVVALTGSPIIAAAVLGAVCLALMFALFMCCSSVFGDSEEDLSTEPQRDGSDADAGNAQADVCDPANLRASLISDDNLQSKKDQ